jgi:hypothetical protein
LNFSADILPNPTSGLFQVDLVSSESEDLTIELLDLRGILIQKEIIKVGNFKTTQTFDATHLASGVYFVKIIGAEGYMTNLTITNLIFQHWIVSGTGTSKFLSSQNLTNIY